MPGPRRPESPLSRDLALRQNWDSATRGIRSWWKRKRDRTLPNPVHAGRCQSDCMRHASIDYFGLRQRIVFAVYPKGHPVCSLVVNESACNSAVDLSARFPARQYASTAIRATACGREDSCEHNEAGPTRDPSLHQRTLCRSAIRGSRALFSRLIVIWTIAGWLAAGIVSAAGGTTATADQTASGQGLGSARDYMQSNSGSYVQSAPTGGYESPFLGIAVQSDTVGLGHGRMVSGVEIVTVIPGSPAGAAGLQGSSPGALRTTVMFIGMVAGAAIFPPAMLGVMALSKIGEPHETIIAVDGERTRNVTEFEQVIEKADAGEVVYLTVVSSGRREQIRVTLPIQ
jgi:hypothetical protein